MRAIACLPLRPPTPSPTAPAARGARPRWRWMAVCRAGLIAAGFLATQVCLGQLPEDPLDVIQPTPELTEAQQDHAEAVAQYTHGRVLLQRASQLEGDAQRQALAAALRCMQRAWWFDHHLVSIMDDIYPPAHALGRASEATRYALIAARQPDAVPELVKLAAMVAAEQNDFQGALDLYQKFVAQSPTPPDGMTQLEIGRMSLLLGKFPEAADALASIRDALDGQAGAPALTADDRTRLLRNPDVTYALLAESFLRAKRLDEAEAMFRRADEAKPNPAMLGLRLALIEKERGNRDRALEQLESYFAAKTTTAGMLPYQLLESLLAPEDASTTAPEARETPPPPSEPLLDKLLQLAANDPHNLFLGYFLADRLRAASRWDEAIAKYRAMLALETTADGHQGLVEIFIKQKQPVPLLEQLGQIVGETGSLEPLGDSIDPLVQDAELREQLATTALAQAASGDTPPSPGVLMAMALLEAKAKNRDRAEEFWTAAMKKPGPAAGQFGVNYAFSLMDQGEPAQTAQAFQRVLDDKLLPDRGAELQYYIAGAWALAQDYDQALAAARGAAQLEPNSARMLAREPWVLYQAKRLAEAETAYQALIDRFDADHSTDDIRDVVHDARFVLSAINVEQGQLAEAEEWLQQVLDEFPEDIGAYNDLGYLWCDQGKHLQRSLAMLQQAVAAEPENVAYRDSLGWALYQVGRYTEAVEELKRAAAADQADGVILDHLGDACLKANDVPAAVEAWQKAAAACERQGDQKRLDQVRDKIRQHAPQ